MAAAREPLPGAAQPLSGAAPCPVSLSTRPAALGCSLGVPGRHQEAALCAFGGLRFCVRVVHPSISLVDHSLVVMIRDLLEILFPAKRTHPRLDGTVPPAWKLELPRQNRGTRPYYVVCGMCPYRYPACTSTSQRDRSPSRMHSRRSLHAGTNWILVCVEPAPASRLARQRLQRARGLSFVRRRVMWTRSRSEHYGRQGAG